MQTRRASRRYFLAIQHSVCRTLILFLNQLQGSSFCRPAKRAMVIFIKARECSALTGYLLLIGIPSSVVNLWSVDNEAVYRLTELFYKFLSRGMPLDLSLQKAKMEFIATASRDRTMPYYWASAVIEGRIDPVVALADIFFEKLFCVDRYFYLSDLFGDSVL